ncbi:MAG TPA: mevalonate kinase [Aggregatilineales bacterium]|nr:mevalonate kinase [Anaerolineales bacterium]HRE46328.1 mevalonate kinase [Aggregatilineales bacterium]
MTAMIAAAAMGKVILFGEHAVVYGQPAVALPFPAVRATARAAFAPVGTGFTILARDVRRVLPVHLDDESPDNALTLAAQLLLRHLKLPKPDLTLEVTSTIPIGGGFGSGAAVSTAIMRVLLKAFRRTLDNETLNSLVYEVEKHHHGTPSGIDNTVIVYERPVYFVRGAALEPFSVGLPLTFVVAYSGVAASTRETVSAVRTLVESEPATYQPLLENIGTLVRAARISLEAGDAPTIGTLLNENHSTLQRLTVSSPLLDRLCEAARESGALGAKLSGGGRGGNIIALAPDEGAAVGIVAALRGAGAARTWIMPVLPPAP